MARQPVAGGLSEAFGMHGHKTSAGYKNALKTITASSIVTALSIEFKRRRDEPVFQKSRSYGMFSKVRPAILSNPEADYNDQINLLPDVSITRRAIENMFSQNAGLAPRKYHQVYRLGRARRKLLNQETKDKSIGDLTAEEGFWEWSRFSRYYRKHFAERPSETPSKIQLSVGWHGTLSENKCPPRSGRTVCRTGADRNRQPSKDASASKLGESALITVLQAFNTADPNRTHLSAEI